MRSHATRNMKDRDPPLPQPEENNLRALPYTSIFLYETADDFASISADTFAGRVPGNSVIVCRCYDRNATIILDRNGRIEMIY
jgi:hypothetical protein